MNIPIINNLDSFIFCDFKKKYAGKPNVNDTEIFKNEFIRDISRVLVYIDFGEGYFLKKDTCENLHTRCKRLNFKTMWPEEKMKKNGEIEEVWKEMSIPEIYKSILKENLPIRLYAKETFKPHHYRLKPFEFNTYTGFKSENQKTGYDQHIISEITGFIKEVICNNNQVCYNYIISWLSNIVQKPYKKTGVAVFLHSLDQGTGKGSFGYWLKNYVFGNHISVGISGLNKLVQKHNTIIDKKLLCLVDELPSNSGDFHSHFDMMKHLITDPECTIEPKGVDPYEIPNMCNFLMMSNNMLSLKIERGDRRYCCIEVGTQRKGDERFWDYLHADILTEETAYDFYNYLNSLNLNDLVSLRKIPDTNLRKRMINNSKPSHVKFFDTIKNTDIIIPEKLYINSFVYKEELISTAIKPKDLYRLYENFCRERKENQLRYNLFFDVVNNKLIKTVRTKSTGKFCIII